jgi:putative drug exporter of the RND superfamily
LPNWSQNELCGLTSLAFGLAGWTRTIIRHRKKVLLLWVVVFVLGGYGASHLSDLLTNRFSVPGSEAEQGRELLSKKLGEKGDGNFTLVVKADDGNTKNPAFRKAASAATVRAAGELKGGRPGPLLDAGKGVAYAQIATPLEAADAEGKTPDMRKAIGDVPGATTYLSGFPAIGHDTEKMYNEDLGKGESIAVPIALLVLAFMFGTLGGVIVPLLFAMFTIPTTLGVVWIAAHFMDMAVYVTNIVTLIGLAIAIDYSMLVVFRFREELAHGDEPHDALIRAMSTAGRATVFSGLVVAVGLALLVFMPLPFMQSMGMGGLVVPVVSILAVLSFLPALLAVLGRGVNRFRIVPRKLLARRAAGEGGFWARLARTIMKRPLAVLIPAAALMILLGANAFRLDVGSGDNRGVPLTTESTKGLKLLEDTLGPGTLAPNQIAVDTGRPGGAFTPDTLAAQRRLVAKLRADPAVAPRTIQAPVLVAPRPGPPDARAAAVIAKAGLADRTGQVIQIRAAPKTDSATPQTVDLVHRLRDTYLPQASFPAGTDVFLTGAPAFGVDVIDKAYGAFPWLVIAVLVLSYLLLLRAFRSLFLPLKAVLMNILSVGATYGLLVLVFQDGHGTWLGFEQFPQVEFWIPIFLFALLFGLSMDYEVFLLSRIREEWDRTHDNEQAVAFGLEHTGRIITAAAIIMVAAFSGFMFGSFVGLQEFGLGLAGAIFLDATVVRMLLVPAAMKLLGKWNWYLPDGIRRVMRLKPASRPAFSTDE